MTITWKINSLDKQESDGLVVTAHWNCTVEKDGVTATVNGATGFAKGDSFKPYEQLTEADVIGWIEGSAQAEQTVEMLLSEIENKSKPAVVSGTPWATVEA